MAVIEVSVRTILMASLMGCVSTLADAKARNAQADEIYSGGPIVTMNDAQRGAE